MLRGDVAVEHVPHQGLELGCSVVLFVLEIQRLPDPVLHCTKDVLNGAVDIMGVRGDLDPVSAWVKLNGLLLVPRVVRVIEDLDVCRRLNLGVVVLQHEGVIGFGLPGLHNVEEVVLKLLTCCGCCLLCGCLGFLQGTSERGAERGQQ